MFDPKQYYAEMMADPVTAQYYRQSKRDYNRELYARNTDYRMRQRRANLARYHRRAAELRKTGANPAMLRTMRERAGMSLSQAAQAAGVRFQTIKAAEQANRCTPIPRDLLQRLATAYNCDMNDFYLRNDG